MKKTLFSIVLLSWLSSTCTSPAHDWRELFNGQDLSGWDTYIGPAYDTLLAKFDGPPVGLNLDPDHVFSVVTEDGKPSIRISGEHFGGISTHDEFKNFHLRLDFKWGTTKWHPKKDDVRDSGLLYHSVGEHGADGGFWMRSQECQVQEGDCGDYWGVAGGMFDVHARKRAEEEYVFDPDSPLITFSATSPAGRRCIKNPDAEKPTGQWNTLELFCLGDTSIHMVNGMVTMVLFNSRQQDVDGESPLAKGKIQIQSEGAEVFYHGIKIRSITRIDEELLKLN